MGRKPRLHIEGGLYHIIARGNNRKEIFKEKEDYTAFVGTLQKVKQKTAFKLYAYSLMPNHFHLLLEVKNISTSEIMQRLLTSYTKYYNIKYKKIGHLFQGRYKSIICEKDNYLLELVRYIHLNPYRARLVKTPLDWEWSSHKEYFSCSSKFIDAKEVLGMLSSNLKQAMAQYSEFVRDGCQMGKRKDYYPQESLPYIGSDNFLVEVASLHTDLITNRLPEAKTDLKYTLKELLEEVANECNIKANSIINGARIKEVAKARRFFIEKAVEKGYKGKDISGYINCSECYITKIKNDKTISKASKA